MKSIIPFLLILCFAVASNGAAADESSAGEALTVALGEDSFPFQYVNEEGQPDGLLIELWREWSRVTQTPVEFSAYPWLEALLAVKQGRVHAHAGMAITEARLVDFEFAEPITEISTQLYLDKELQGKTKISDLLPYQIGLVSGASHEAELLKLEPNLVFKYYPSREALFAAVERGELLVFAGMNGYLREQNLSSEIAGRFPASARIPIRKGPVVPAVGKGNFALRDKIAEGFSRLDPNVVKRAERRWLGYNHSQSGLAIAMQLGVEPYVDLGIDGMPHGLYVDIWRLWSSKTGIEIDFVPADMSGSLDEVRRGLADAHIGYPESDTLKSGLKRAWHLYKIKSRLFLYGAPLGSLEELIGEQLGVVSTAPYLAKLQAQLPDVSLKIYDSVSAMTQAARAGEIRGFVASGAWTQHYLLLNKMWSEFHQSDALEFHTDIYVLTRDNDTGLAEQIAAGFNLIDHRELAELEQKWMLNPQDHIFTEHNRHISLSQAQQAYLAGLGELKVGYLKQWAPMEFTDAQGKFAGINSDVFHEISRQLNLPLMPVEYPDWHSLFAALKHGDIALAGSVAKTAERATSIKYTEAYWPSPWALVSALDQVSVFTLDRLAGRRVALVEGYHIVSKLMSQQPNIDLVLVPDSKAGLDAVVNGKADVFIEKVLTLAEALQGGKYVTLKMSLLSDFAEQQSHIGIHPSHDKLVPLINLALTQIDSAKQQQINRKWVSFALDSESAAYKRWLKYGAVGVAALSIIVILVLLVNRRLNIEIARRKQVEKCIQHMAHHDSLTNLPNRTLLDDRLTQAILSHSRDQARFALLFIDLDGFKAVNDSFGHDVGDKLLADIAQSLTVHIRKSDTLARFGGDEFIVLLNRIQDLDSVHQVADNIISVVERGVESGGLHCEISASIGIAIYPGDGDNAIELLKLADKMMYRAKSKGGRCYVGS